MQLLWRSLVQTDQVLYIEPSGRSYGKDIKIIAKNTHAKVEKLKNRLWPKIIQYKY